MALPLGPLVDELAEADLSGGGPFSPQDAGFFGGQERESVRFSRERIGGGMPNALVPVTGLPASRGELG
jgi:hypothetical protein